MTKFSIHTLDLPQFVNQLSRQTIGFDRMFDELNKTVTNSRGLDNYPPYNIAKLDDTHFVIEVAVAGFAESELDVELKDSKLTITGKKEKLEDATEPTFVHKGISTRNFVREFNLADHVEVRGAKVVNGILSVALEQIVPEEKKAKKIAISYEK